jgi:hypothetical protein
MPSENDAFDALRQVELDLALPSPTTAMSRRERLRPATGSPGTTAA